MIEYLDLYKRFDVPVLAGVSLTIGEGETFSVLGPSGTGKSVLLKTTIGLIVPDRGDVRIEGDSVFRDGGSVLEAIRRKVRYVFQYAALFDSLSVYENVALGLPEGAEGVGRNTTTSVVFMIISVLVVDAIFPPLFLN